jgi:hypothetical protein
MQKKFLYRNGDNALFNAFFDFKSLFKQKSRYYIYQEVIMKLIKSYVTDKKGNIKDVIISYENYKRIEEILIDAGLGKAMEEIIDDEEIDIAQAKRLVKYKNGS